MKPTVGQQLWEMYKSGEIQNARAEMSTTHFREMTMYLEKEGLVEAYNDLRLERDLIEKGGENNMTGLDKARETAAKLKEETAKEQETKALGKANAVSALEALKANPIMADLYKQSAHLGAENLGAQLPILKVYAAGRSKSELADGTRPNDGWFFYKPNAEQFESVTVHILTISKGYQSKGMNETDKDKYNQIMGGVIVDGDELKPFVMYLNGTKLNNMWEFGKQAKQYTQFGVPMFSLFVKLTTERQTNNFGESWVVNFKIQKDEKGAPLLVMDQGEFVYLRDNVSMLEETIASVIGNAAKDGVIADVTPSGEIVEDQGFQTADDIQF
jgi:hypothetical protein